MNFAFNNIHPLEQNAEQIIVSKNIPKMFSFWVLQEIFPNLINV